MRELGLAARRLRRQPVFVLVAVLTIAVGAGATTAIFSLLYEIVLRPLPYQDAERLVFVWNSYPRMAMARASVSIPDYLDRLEQARSIRSATLVTIRTLNLGVDERPEQLRALAVTPSFFETLGRTPKRGRGFLETEAQPGADHVVIVSSGLWQSRFGGDPALVGRDIRLNGEGYRVVGILPADLQLPAVDVTLLVPFAFTPAQRSDQERGQEFSQMIARLAPGATTAGLEREMAGIIERVLDRLPQRRPFAESSGFRGLAVPIREQLVGDMQSALYLIQAGVLIVLLIACVNVTNLMLIRASQRQRDMAIRTALGAPRSHLLVQMPTEGFVIAVAGAATGLLIGIALRQGLRRVLADQLPVSLDTAPYGVMLLAAAALAFLIASIIGAVPALAVLRADLISPLNDETGRTAGSRRSTGTRSALVVAETALALILLVGAGLLLKSFVNLQHAPMGFSPRGVITATLALPPARYAKPDDQTAFWRRLLENARSIPGVTAAGLTSNIPLSGNVGSGSYSIVGYAPGPGDVAPHGRQELVGGDYFRAMQIPLRAGRLFDERDGPGAPPVAIVDEFLVQRYFRDGSPLGRQIRRGGAASPAITIVGVVGTINAIDLAQPVDKERLYYPVPQQPFGALGLVLKTAVDPASVIPPLRDRVRQIDPDQPIATVRTMEEWIARSTVTRRTPLLLFAGFAAVALLLAVIGTYGVLAFGVSQRTRELGIRQALGADGPAILSLIVRQGLSRVAVGIVVGGAGAAALSRLMRAQLFGVVPLDPAVIAAAILLLLVATTAACLIPAWRATQVVPSQALREG
jgi:predicted permease